MLSTPSSFHLALTTWHSVKHWSVVGKRLVVGVGRLVPRKGFDQTIRGWQDVVAQHPTAHLMIVGDGPQRPELQELIASAGLQKHITLTGPLSDADLLAAYRSADLFIMPNRTMPDGDTEGFGLVFLEANACGRAVIGGKAGGAVEAVRDGETGLLVDGNSVQEIVSCNQPPFGRRRTPETSRNGRPCACPSQQLDDPSH